MLIEFDKMETEVIPHMKDGEKQVYMERYVDPMNRIMRGRLVPGASIGLHTHDTSCEVFYILSGKGKILYDDGCEPLEAGSCHFCPKGHAHSLINDSPEGGEDLCFFGVVSEQ